MIDTIFKDEEGCVWYMDDILIYGATSEAEYQGVVDKVLQECVKHELVVNLTKSELHVHETMFLGHIVNGSQVQVNSGKLETMSK